MKKIFTLVLLAFVSFSFAHANNDPNKDGDDNKETTTSSFQDRPNMSQGKWFVSVGAGAQVYIGDHDKQIGFGKRISPKFEITAGTWFHPLFGVRVNANLSKMKGLTQHGGPGGVFEGLSTGVQYRAWDDLWHQEFTYVNVHADFMFDWLNDVSGVNPDRLYSLIPYVGVGFITVVDRQKGTTFTPNLGILQSFKVSNNFNVNLDVKGNIFADKVDGELGGRNFEGQISAVVGLQYSF